MTCGCCDPSQFKSESGGRVFGYTAAPTRSGAMYETRRLFFMGARVVFYDDPQGQVRHRPEFNRLIKIARPGDRIILSTLTALGTKAEYQRKQLARMREWDLEVCELIAAD